jgi:hypothetical protein
MINIPLVLQLIRPNAEWSLNGEIYSGLEWFGPGDKPTLAEIEAAWDSRPAAPVVVSFRSLAFALLQAGLYEQVKTAALATPEGEIWWNTAQSTTVHRDHPFVIALGAAIGQTPEQLDAIFASALASQW